MTMDRPLVLASTCHINEANGTHARARPPAAPIISVQVGQVGRRTSIMAFSASRREFTVLVAALLVLQQIICVASSMPFSSRGMVSNLPPVASVASSAYAPAARPPIPSTFTGRCRSATLGRSRRVLLGEGKEHEIVSSSIFDLRGGASVISEDDDNEYDLDDSSSEESDIDLDDESSEVEEEEGDEEEEETDDEDEEDSKVSSSSPVKLVISTGLGCPLIDQTLETNASRSRTIATIRQTVSRQMKGRPPIESVRLLLGNRVLRDDEIIDDLAPDEDDEDDELDEDDEEDDEDDGMVKLRLTLDAVPPVDPKFGVELQEQLQKMSTAELLEAYAANAAAAHEGVAHMFACASAADDHLSEDNDDDEEEDDEEDNIGGKAATPVITTMRQHAALIKESIVETMPQNAIEILNQSADESEGAALASVVASAHRHRRGGAMKGGASTQVKRALQRNLNIVSCNIIEHLDCRDRYACLEPFVVLIFSCFPPTQLFPVELGGHDPQLCFVSLLWVLWWEGSAFSVDHVPRGTPLLCAAGATCKDRHEAAFLYRRKSSCHSAIAIASSSASHHEFKL